MILVARKQKGWDEDTDLSDASSHCLQIQDFGPGFRLPRQCIASGLPAEIISQGSHDGDVIGELELCSPQLCYQPRVALEHLKGGKSGLICAIECKIQDSEDFI